MSDELRKPFERTLFRVTGKNSDGAWGEFVLTDSPTEAIEAATNKHAWDILHGLHVSVVLDFIDASPAQQDRREA